jgi:hypothetical protein
MTLTPLHIAFVLVLKPMLRKLDFVALTVGAVSHSRHRASGSLDVWLVSVLWLGFSMLVCSRQAGLHSIVGALPIDAILTIFFVKSIGKLGVERCGIRGFTNVKIEAVFLHPLRYAACPMFSSTGSSTTRQTQFSGPFW